MRTPAPALLLTLAVLSVGGPAALGADAPPAHAREARQFDFWLGYWSVSTPDGKHAGDSRIERIANGFGLLENWSGAGGYSGKSLNAWNAAKKHWQQFWIGSEGSVLELAGGLDPRGRMVLSGEHVTDEGMVSERITWTPHTDGSVQQLWEQSRDGGKTWQVAFDGHYVKQEKDVATGGGSGSREKRFYLLQ